MWATAKILQRQRALWPARAEIWTHCQIPGKNVMFFAGQRTQQAGPSSSSTTRHFTIPTRYVGMGMTAKDTDTDMMAPVITKTSAKITSDTATMGEDEWLAWIKSLEPMDVERELHKIKRNMGSFYTLGHYGDALTSALKLERVIESTIGKKNPVYASCLNNIALMNKMLGNTDVASDKYSESLQVYEETVGKQHPSYAATMSNIGILYRGMAESVTGMDRIQHLDSAEQALKVALEIRVDLAPNKQLAACRDALNSAMNLALVRRTMKKGDDAVAVICQDELRGILDMCRELCGDADSMTAVVLSNLGLVMKGRGLHEDALVAYQEALDIRSKTLGDAHPDSIVSMHNLAELYLAMGEEKKSEELQQGILDILDKNPATSSASGASSSSEANDSEVPQGRGQPGLTAKQPFQPSNSSSGEAPKVGEGRKEFQPQDDGPPVTFATRKMKGKGKGKKG